MNVKTKTWRAILRVIQRRSGTPVINRLRNIAGSVYRAAHNPSYDIATNGEMRVMQIVLQAFERKIVFDVGANVGNWSKDAARYMSDEDTIFAFEPSGKTFARLRERTEGYRNIRCFNIGLSAITRDMEIAYSATNPEKSSVELHSATSLNRRIGDYEREVQSFRSGFEFCVENGVSDISFMKIDTESHDYQVLKGFAPLLEDGRIKVIQFEYNRLNIFSKALLSDFYALLDPAGATDGFLIGRIYPGSVQFKPYSPLDETFIDGNFLAVRRSLTPLIDRLQG